MGNICAKLEQNLTSSHREIHMTKLFVAICCSISGTDTAPVVITQEAQLQTMGRSVPNCNKIRPVGTEKFTKQNCLFTFAAVLMILIQLQ